MARIRVSIENCHLSAHGPRPTGSFIQTCSYGLLLSVLLMGFTSGVLAQRIQVDSGEILLSMAPEISSAAVGGTGGSVVAGTPLTVDNNRQLTSSPALQASSGGSHNKQVKFALISSQRATVRASLGPYSASQTVYHNRTASSSATSGSMGKTPSLDDAITPHVVHSVVYRHNPQVRVVFHVARRDFRSGVCITVFGTLSLSNGAASSSLGASEKAPLVTKCQPLKENGACLAELVIPADWWPSAWMDAAAASNPHTKSQQQLKKTKPHVRLTYSVGDDLNCQLTSSADPLTKDGNSNGKLEVGNFKHIANVPLSPVHATYEKISLRESPVEVFLPETPLYPNNVVYAPIFVRPDVRQFVISANVLGSLHVERLEPVARHVWKVAIENKGNKNVRITCSRIDDIPNVSSSTSSSFASTGGATSQSEHVFDILLRVDPEPDLSGDQTIEWQIDDRIESVSQLNLQKDKVQSILLITASRDLINTAIITGKQVAQTVKLIMVSEAGQISDVTHKASCHSSDESVLKVSPSCSLVYVDGSEIRSAANVSIHVKYLGHMSETFFTVWTPETPFSIKVSDERLSHIKQWHSPQSSSHLSNSASPIAHSWHRNSIPKDECRLRFQQSEVRVFTRFVAVNHNSGRENYLLGKRRLEADITEMVHLRSSNTHIAQFVGPNIVSGVHAGRADVQVISPTTEKVLATKTIQVVQSKEMVSSISARVVSGLNLSVQPDFANSDLGQSYINGKDPSATDQSKQTSSTASERAIYVAKVTTDDKMTSRYQEAVLDITLRFTDGTSMNLEHFNSAEYNVTVESMDPNVVVVAPNQNGGTGGSSAAPHPRIICVGQGSGDLLSLTLGTSDICAKRGGASIQDATVFVSCMASSPDSFLYKDAQVPRRYSAASVTFELQPHKSGGVGNPGIGHFGSSGVGGVGATGAHHLNHLTGSPLQVGLYTLFGVFCMALLAFVASCSVFAVHIKNSRNGQQAQNNSSSKDNGQDWVWLSKETLEQAVRPKNVSKFANIVVNPMGELDNSRHLNLNSNGSRGNNLHHAGSDGFSANLCQNGDDLLFGRSAAAAGGRAERILQVPTVKNSPSPTRTNHHIQHQTRHPIPPVPIAASRPLPSEPIDVRNNNVPQDNNNSDMSINMNHHHNPSASGSPAELQPMLPSRHSPVMLPSHQHTSGGGDIMAASGGLSFNQIFGGLNDPKTPTVSIADSGFNQTCGVDSSNCSPTSSADHQSILDSICSVNADGFSSSEAPVSRPNLLMMQQRSSAERGGNFNLNNNNNNFSRQHQRSVCGTSAAGSGGCSNSVSPSSSCGGGGAAIGGGGGMENGRQTSGIIVNPMMMMVPSSEDDEMDLPQDDCANNASSQQNAGTAPPVPPHRQANTNNASDTLNWRRLERQYNNNREKLAEYLDSLQESIA